MRQQNDINKQFSENNNAVFSSYVALIAAIIAVFYLYVEVLMHGYSYETDELFFTSCLVILVLDFLACLSINLGYSRSRDFLVACASDPKDPYSVICSSKEPKGIIGFLLSAYKVFFCFFTVTVILFSLYSILNLFCVRKCGYGIITIILLLLSIVIIAGVNRHYHKKYCDYFYKSNNYVKNNGIVQESH